eukprot:GFUD01066863.1.p1 GENE.GFUD01066863.1~~GFUD01066863.1.p1  ORF type:complete len:653 (-),score=83.91 GFUD01066863.1:291-2249(-)
MPLRSRLPKTGLKLKIPARNAGSSASPYGPSRHSASPIRRRDGSNSRKPNWPKDFSPSGQSPTRWMDKRQQKLVNSNSINNFSQTVTSFDAAIDDRPVWAVKEEKPRPCTDGFRSIPIQKASKSPVLGLFGCDNVASSNNNNISVRPKSSSTEKGNSIEIRFDDDERLQRSYLYVDSDPESPILDLASSPDFFTNRSPLVNDLQRINQRAEHLRDWFYNLSPKTHSIPNPFFGSRIKKDISYSHSRYLSSPVPTFRSRSGISPSSSLGTSNDGSILTPTDQSILENPLNAAARRDSSGILQSPDVLDPAKEDGFYLLKKDSQRRATLVKIMKDDKHNICATWHSLLLKDVHDSCITIHHLATLMDGMKGYIPEQNQQPLEKALSDLREALDYDGAKINHLQLALYLFQDAVNSILRMHSIKPHWMFALDNLVRTAVQAAILVLSPELGAHLAESGSIGPLGNVEPPPSEQAPDIDQDNGGGSTSGVSTVNSGILPNHGAHRMMSNLGRMREENRQLLTDLLQAQSGYQELLKQSLAEQKLHLQLLSQSLAASHLSREEQRSLVSHVSMESHRHMLTDSNEVKKDPALVTWLQNLGLNNASIDRIVSEDLTLSDVLDLMSRDDLKRLGLKAGPELRIWRAILQHRNIPLTPTP